MALVLSEVVSAIKAAHPSLRVILDPDFGWPITVRDGQKTLGELTEDGTATGYVSPVANGLRLWVVDCSEWEDTWMQDTDKTEEQLFSLDEDAYYDVLDPKDKADGSAGLYNEPAKIVGHICFDLDLD